MFISGTDHQKNREGEYYLTKGTCNGRSVYIHSEGDDYLYFISGTSSDYWLVGSESCISYGGIIAYDSATYPQDVTAVWQETNGFNWKANENINVKCYTGMKMLSTYFRVSEIINSRTGYNYFAYATYFFAHATYSCS